MKQGLLLLGVLTFLALVVAPASAVDWVYTENFDYPNGRLNGNDGWDGSAGGSIGVIGQQLRIAGGSSVVDSARVFSYTDNITWIKFDIMAGAGTDMLWNFYVDSAGGKNLARWYGTGTTARGRIAGYDVYTEEQTLSGPGVWDTLAIKLSLSENTSEFFFNDVSIGVLDHSVSSAGDYIGKLKWERMDSPDAIGDYVYFDNLKVAVPEPSSLLALGALSFGALGFLKRRR
jgi:hypothetical protein